MTGDDEGQKEGWKQNKNTDNKMKTGNALKTTNKKIVNKRRQ